MLVDIIPKRQQTTQLGSIVQNDKGILMMYDNKRSKWLSISRDTISFGIDNIVTSNRWLMYNKILTNLQGFDITRNMTMTLISARSINNSNCKFKISYNSGEIISIELNNESKKVNDNVNVNVNVNSNDTIQVFLEVNSVVEYPTLLIEYAWR